MPDDAYQVVEHLGAIYDIEEMLDRIRVKSDLETAVEWDKRLRRSLHALGNMPKKFPVFADAPPRAVYRTHFEQLRHIYYEVFEAERVVRVLYVWHGHRDDTPDLARQNDPLV